MNKKTELSKKVDSIIDNITMCNSYELTENLTNIELRGLIGALVAQLSAHNLFVVNMQLQNAEWNVAVSIVRELYEKHLEIGLYSDLYDLWLHVKKFLGMVETIEERTSCAQDSSTNIIEEDRFISANSKMVAMQADFSGDDIEMLMRHCRNSLSANGEILGAMTRIKKFVEEAQKPYTNNARDEICPACGGSKFIKLDPCTVRLFKCGLCNGTGKLSPIA